MDSKYDQEIKERILFILSTCSKSLCSIIEESLGAYPNDVNRILNVLIAERLISINDGLYYNGSVSDFTPKEKPINIKKDENSEWIKENISKLSNAHPADYDWRFTAQTVNDVLILINKYKSDNCHLALFGVTTLFPVVTHFNSDIKAYLYNKSKSLISDLKMMGYQDGLINHDLFFPLNTEILFDIVFADPPWYLDFYKVFIQRASETTKIGGYLFLSVLPLLTRPNADFDRKVIEEYCEFYGFEACEIKESFLTYESPLFEQQTLVKLGIHCADWRKGDLVIYKKMRLGSQKLLPIPNFDEPIWDEFIFWNKKLKLLTENDAGETFDFEYADIGKMFSSVSRRSPVRKRINFWTSDNLAFKIKKLEVLRHLFRFVIDGHNKDEAVKLVQKMMKLNSMEVKRIFDLLREAEL